MESKQKKIILIATAISVFAGLGTFIFFCLKNKLKSKKDENIK